MFPPNEIYLAALMRAQSAAQLLPHLVRAASVPEAKIQVDKTHSFTDIGCRLQGCLPDLRQSPGHQCAWHVTVSICHYSGTSHTLLFRIYAHEHASAPVRHSGSAQVSLQVRRNRTRETRRTQAGRLHLCSLPRRQVAGCASPDANAYCFLQKGTHAIFFLKGTWELSFFIKVGDSAS